MPSLRLASESVLINVGAGAAVRACLRGRLRVLAYHGVEDPSLFAAQMDYLVRRYRPVSVGDVIRTVEGRGSLPDHAVLITFDDGQRSVLEVALPILQRHSLPAVLFVIGGLVGTRDLPWWEEVARCWDAGARLRWLTASSSGHLVRLLKRRSNEERLRALESLRREARQGEGMGQNLSREELRNLQSQGIEIGNHTLTHPCLDRCASPVLQREIEEAQEVLIDALGHAPRTFAFPNGNHDRRAGPVLKRLGVKLAFLFDHSLQRIPPDDPLAVSRLRVDSITPSARFRLIVDGLHPLVHQALRRN